MTVPRVAVAAGAGGETMSARSTLRLAWGLAALTAVLLVGAVALSLATGIGVDVRAEVFIWAIGLVFAAMGASSAG